MQFKLNPRDLAVVLTLIFLAFAAFSTNTLMAARAWVVWPIMLATAIVCWKLEDLK